MTKYIIGAIIAIVLLLLGYYVGHSEREVVESIRVDTLRVEMPVPIEVEKLVDEQGKQVFAVEKLPIVEPLVRIDTLRVVDSVEVQIPISMYSFEGEGWSASVSGYSVQVENLEVATTTITQSKPLVWELSAVVGIDPYTPWVGASAKRRFGRFYTSLDVGYSLRDSSPYVRAQGGVVLFSR